MATIKNPGDPEITGNARIIFDSGSQRSFVTNRLKDSLKLPIVGRENMIIKSDFLRKSLLDFLYFWSVGRT